MPYILEPFKNEYRAKIFLDLAAQPDLQRLLPRIIPENWLREWAIDHETNSYFHSIAPPGMTEEHWCQFYIAGRSFLIAFSYDWRALLATFRFIRENKPAMPENFNQQLQAALNVHGAVGLEGSIDKDGDKKFVLSCVKTGKKQ